MVLLPPPAQVSAFIASHLTDFLDKYGISFCIDGPQLEYFVFQKDTGQDISCSLTLSLDDASAEINVMTFYPGLYLHPETRYFSAVCFYMVLQHFAHFHHINCDCRICLNTKKIIFESFYSVLQDFDFHILLSGEDDHVAIESHFLALDIDTSMFLERALVD